MSVLGRLAEIAARRHVDAPRAAAEIDRVEIELENLRLAQRLLDARGHDHLADLALVGDVFADQQVLRHLLGDGRAALRPAGLRKVADEGADQAALVDALVLDRSACPRPRRTPSARTPEFRASGTQTRRWFGLEQLGEALALAVEHDAGAGQLQVLELVVIGQVGERLVVELDHRRRDRPPASSTFSFLQNCL